MNADQALRLAQAHVGTKTALVRCTEPPEGFYDAKPGAEFLFLVHPANPTLVGGSEVIAVDKESGAVRSAGYVGE